MDEREQEDLYDIANDYLNELLLNVKLQTSPVNPNSE